MVCLIYWLLFVHVRNSPMSFTMEDWVLKVDNRVDWLEVLFFFFKFKSDKLHLKSLIQLFTISEFPSINNDSDSMSWWFSRKICNLCTKIYLSYNTLWAKFFVLFLEFYAYMHLKLRHVTFSDIYLWDTSCFSNNLNRPFSIFPVDLACRFLLDCSNVQELQWVGFWWEIKMFGKCLENQKWEMVCGKYSPSQIS